LKGDVNLTKECRLLNVAMLPLVIIALSTICTYAAAEGNTTDIIKSLVISDVVASGDNKYVEISNNLSEMYSLKNWALVINGVQIHLPEHSLQSGQKIRIHLGKGEGNDTDLFLDSAAQLNDITDEVILKNDTGKTIASLRYEKPANGSRYCNVTGSRAV
jgi:hypothetical protein